MNHRESAIAAARAERERRPVYLDTETTGLQAADQIVEICVLDADGAVLVETLVRPTCPVSHGAYRVHRIGALELREAPSWATVWPRVAPVLTGRRVGIFNAQFDLTMMRQTHGAHGMAWDARACDAFCIMELYAQYAGDWRARSGGYRWHSLEDAGRACRIALPHAHRAVADARLARAVLQHMAESR